MGKDKFEVRVDKETHMLYVDVEVLSKPSWQGVLSYDTSKVMKILNEQGYNVTERDCTSMGRMARSDSGNGEEYSKSKWVFRLTSTDGPEEVTTVKVPEPEAPKTSKKATDKTSTKTKKTTADVLKSYKTKKTSRKKTKNVVE